MPIGVYPRKADRYPRKRSHPVRHISLSGYVVIGERPHILEHRKVWEDAHGPIPPGYVIHHIDEDRQNNALSNLTLMTRGAHTRLHLSRPSSPCVVCGRKSKAKKRCMTHYGQLRKGWSLKRSMRKWTNG